MTIQFVGQNPQMGFIENTVLHLDQTQSLPTKKPFMYVRSHSFPHPFYAVIPVYYEVLDSLRLIAM